jgi:hypothetical protein
MDENPPDTDDVIDQISFRHPSYKYVQVIRHSSALLFPLLMIGGGGGLLFMYNWARYLTLGYCLLSLVHSLAVLSYGSIVYLPALFKISRELNDMGADQADLAIEARFGALVVVAFVLVAAVYPVIVAVLLLIPPVNRAFRGEPAAQPPADRFPIDDLDDYHHRFGDGGQRYLSH